MSADERRTLVDQLTQDILGYGPIQQFLEDPDVTEVMVNSTDQIYVERKGNINGGPRRKKRNKAKLDRLSLSDLKEGEDQTTRDPNFSFVTLVFQMVLVIYLLSFLYQVFIGRHVIPLS